MLLFLRVLPRCFLDIIVHKTTFVTRNTSVGAQVSPQRKDHESMALTCPKELSARTLLLLPGLDESGRARPAASPDGQRISLELEGICRASRP
jgi:hypothetical protein